MRNPVDMIASANAQSYEMALDCVLRDGNIDAAIAAFVPPLGIHTEDIARALVRTNAGHREKTLLAVLMGQEGLPAGMAQLHQADIPGYLFPESAARALSAMWRYRKRQTEPEGATVSFDTDDAAVSAAIERTRDSGALKLSEPDALRILEAYGIAVTPWKIVEAPSVDELPPRAVAAGDELGFPLVLKVVSPEIIHKTDVGGVALDIQSPEELRAAVTGMISRVNEHFEKEARIAGLLVQRMAPSGRETIVGLTRIPSVGPMVMFGLGGIYVEALRDVSLRMSPLTDVDAQQMIREVKTHKLLEGLRGEAPRDIEALVEALLRASQLAERHPEIAEMDINPLISQEEGAVAVDARFQLASRE